MGDYVVIVAFEVDAPSMEHAQDYIMGTLLPMNPPTKAFPFLESWWIAEDERYDGSDNDSAVFVPEGMRNMGVKQSNVTELLQYMESTGYTPYMAITVLENDRLTSREVSA